MAPEGEQLEQATFPRLDQGDHCDRGRADRDPRLGPGPRQRCRRPRFRQHRLHQGRQGWPALRSAEDDRRRRRTRGAEPDQRKTGRSAHFLTGHQGFDPEDPESAADLLHAESHLHVDRQVARCQRQRPGESEPGRSRCRRLGHARQREQEGRLLVHGHQARRLDRAEGDRSRGLDDLLHVRDPPLDARLD